MRFPVDTTTLTFRVTAPPRADVDFETKRQKTKNDLPLQVVTLLVMDGEESEQIRVRVPEGKAELLQDMQVTPRNLSCLFWSMGERSGLSFAADALDAVPARPVPSAAEKK